MTKEGPIPAVFYSDRIAQSPRSDRNQPYDMSGPLLCGGLQSGLQELASLSVRLQG